jgi:hypothetical protein
MPIVKDSRSASVLLKGYEIKPYFTLRKKNKTKLKLKENYCPKCKKGVEISEVQFIKKGRLTNDNLQIIRKGKCKICRTNTNRFFSSKQLEALKIYVA